METHNQPDAAIDKTLAALNAAAPPAGMEARIAARLEQSARHAKTRPTSRWRALLTGESVTGAWFRGALAGAAVALFAVAAVLALRSSKPGPQQFAASATHNRAITPVSTSPCNPAPYPRAHPTAFHVAAAATPHIPETPWTENIAENIAPSRPAPAMPLTAQERQLVRLVRVSDPGQLAAISHEAQPKPQDAAEDAKFFAPPPPPPPQASETPADTKPVPDAEATPETNPEATPEADQSGAGADSDATSPANP